MTKEEILGWRHQRCKLYMDYVYLHEIGPKLGALLAQYGKAFDDEYTYQLAGRSAKIVKRRPLWLGWQTENKAFIEKHNPHPFHSPKQKQLF